ncbi:MAG: DUF4153 domain-containing protein [Owenweeksia sp.]
MKPILSFLAFLCGFHILFWHEALGLNLVIFGALIITIGYLKERPLPLRPVHLYLLTLTLANAIAVLWLNTLFSNTLFALLTLTTYGSFQLKEASVLEGFSNGVLNIFNYQQGLIPGLASALPAPRTKGALYLRLSLVPLLIFIFYLILFSAGNSIFNAWGEQFFGSVRRLFKDWSVAYTLFLVLGVILARWALRSRWGNYIRIKAYNELKRKTRLPGVFRNMGLKHEYLTAFILLVLLNLLFLAVNIIDIRWVWFQFYVPAEFSLKDFVHEGVGWLIFTLLLSMGLILFYFRGNLNFYKDNYRLKILAYLWIFQNTILAISVVIRTFYYIGFHGLAPGRIGVLLFLTMVLLGLASLAWKIRNNYNNTYVLKVNTLFVIGVLGIAALLPWNHIILNHNLAHGNINEIDVDHYLELDPQVYPLVYENLQLIGEQIRGHQKNERTWISYTSLEEFRKALDWRAENYIALRSDRSLASWSYADQKAVKALTARIDQ